MYFDITFIDKFISLRYFKGHFLLLRHFLENPHMPTFLQIFDNYDEHIAYNRNIFNISFINWKLKIFIFVHC